MTIDQAIRLYRKGFPGDAGINSAGLSELTEVLREMQKVVNAPSEAAAANALHEADYCNGADATELLPAVAIIRQEWARILNGEPEGPEEHPAPTPVSVIIKMSDGTRRVLLGTDACREWWERAKDIHADWQP